MNRLLTGEVRFAHHLASEQTEKTCRTPRGTEAPRRLGPRCRQGRRHHSASATEPEPPEDSKPVSCPLKCLSRSSSPPTEIGRETEAGRAYGFIPFRLHSKKSKAVSPHLRTTRGNREGREDGEGVESNQGPGSRPTLPHSRWRHGRGEVPQRRYRRMRSAESRPGTQDGGSGAGEGEAEAAKRAVEQNV